MDKLYVSDIANLLNEWNYKKNNELNLYPNEVTHGSVKKVWWKCKEGHEWQATPNNRERGIGCPYCYGRYPVKGVNDLATTHPALIKEWNYEKNGMLVPEMFKEKSNKKVWWVCSKCEHEWQAFISNRAKGVGCPKCSSKRNGERKMMPSTRADSLYEKSPELIAEWNYNKNKTISPTQIKPRSNKKVWWKCKEGHEWQATPNSRYEGYGCPYCSNQKVLECYNDLLTVNPELAKEWNYERNGELRPENIGTGSNKKVWWKCKKGHEWEAVVSYRNSGAGCPYCSNKKVLTGYNDLLTVNPELAKEWNYEKNGDLAPEKIVAGSGKRVWWKCDKGHEWQALISSRNKNHKCPECLSGLRTSLPEQAIYYYVSKVFNDAINTYKPEGFNGKEIDIYIPSINLGIEYDGIAWHKKSERDLEKNKLARQNKIDLIRIREKGCPILGDEVHCIETDKYDFNLLFIEQPIKLLLEYIEEKYGVPCHCDIDVIRDYDTIFESLNLSSKENSIEITHPALMKEWDYERNGSSLPNMFVAGSEKKVWWICQKNHHYQASVYSRSKGSGCPYCAGRSVLRGYNDFADCKSRIGKRMEL